MNTTLRLCTVCGAEFETRRPLQKICSAGCRRQKAVEYSTAYKKNQAEVHTIHCKICGAQFHTPDKDRKLCSNPVCRGKHSARNALTGRAGKRLRTLLDSKLLENDEL